MMTVTKEEVIAALVESRDRITPAGAWTKGTMARDMRQRMVPANSIQAVCWCMSGTVAVTAEKDNYILFGSIRFALHEVIYDIDEGCLSISNFNDAFGRTQAEVIDVFNKAIKNLEEAK